MIVAEPTPLSNVEFVATREFGEKVVNKPISVSPASNIPLLLASVKVSPGSRNPFPEIPTSRWIFLPFVVLTLANIPAPGFKPRVVAPEVLISP